MEYGRACQRRVLKSEKDPYMIRASLVVGVCTACCAVVTAVALCKFPAVMACNDWGEWNYQCPYDPDELDIRRSVVSPGVSANHCVAIAYSTQGNTECQNDGGPIQCVWSDTITFCDGDVVVINHTTSYQPQTPGGGDPCTL